MSRRGSAVVTAALTVGAIVGLGTALPALTAPEPVGGSERAFTAGEPTWAQGSTLHYGEQSFDVGPEVVQSVLRTPYGFFLDLAESARPQADRRFVFFDGTRTVDVPGEVSEASVSPHGRYAGWVDFDGPLRLAGRIAEVVVVDLATGDVIFRDHDNMGGDFGDDLGDRYEELEPSLLGFDDGGRVYWVDAEGGGNRWRANPTTGQKERVDVPEPFDRNVAPSTSENPYNPRLGLRVAWDSGEILHDDYGAGETIYLSADGRHGVDLSRTGKVRVYDVRTGRVIRLEHGSRWTYFAGWGDASTLYAMIAARREVAYDPDGPDRTEATLVACQLPSGRCSDLVQVTGTHSMRFGHGLRNALEAY